MAITHQKFREIVFLLLYRKDFAQSEDSENISLIMEQLAVTRKNVLEAAKKAQLVQEKLPEIDEKIAKTSTTYEFERIQLIERNVLRLGIYELFYDSSIPPKVAIAEAVRLTKKFSSAASTSFVNAILDHLYKKNLGEKSDDAAIRQAFLDLKNEDEVVKQKNASQFSEEQDT